MRAYHFCSFYLSSIQQGIQAAHAQTSLFVKYRLGGPEPVEMHDTLWEWTDEPTMICLNAGPTAGVREIYEFFDLNNHQHPYANFYEDEISLGGIMTNAVIVVPEKIYEAHNELIFGKKYSSGFRGKSRSYRSMVEFMEDLYADPAACDFKYDYGSLNRAYDEFTRTYGRLDPFDFSLADKLREYRLAC